MTNVTIKSLVEKLEVAKGDPSYGSSDAHLWYRTGLQAAQEIISQNDDSQPQDMAEPTEYSNKAETEASASDTLDDCRRAFEEWSELNMPCTHQGPYCSDETNPYDIWQAAWEAKK